VAGKEEEEGVLRGDGEREEAGWGWGRSASGALSRRTRKWRMPPCPTTMLTMTQVGFSFLSAQRRCSLHAADSKTEKPLTKAELARKALDKKHDDHFAAFPVVITTYDLIIKDRALIGGIPWSCVLSLSFFNFHLHFFPGSPLNCAMGYALYSP
jgi:SNF2 family DNA or RNA helicase